MADFKPDEYIDSRTMNNIKPKPEPKVDELVSKAVGKKILVNNPILIKKIVEWSKARGEGDAPDNFLDDPKKVEELRKIL